MNLITGFLMAALLGKQSEKLRSPLLNLRGPVATKHLLPGRVRFHIPSLVGDMQHLSSVAQLLQKLEGVESAKATPLTGSLLVKYREDTIQPELLVAALIRLLGLEKELAKTPGPRLVTAVREGGDALNRVVYDYSGGLIDLWTTVPIVLAVVGIRRLLLPGTNKLPTALTMVWWAYMLLFPRRPRSN